MTTPEHNDKPDFAEMFRNMLDGLIEDPQFVACGVMTDSLGGLLDKMSPQQRLSTQKLIAQFAHALDEAGMLIVPEVRDED